MVIESLHSDLEIKKGELFVKTGQQNFQIGQLIKGVLRGFSVNEEGDEVNTHFYIEGDLVSGNYIPNIPATMNIQALEDSVLSVANYHEVFSHVNKDTLLTKTVLFNFQKLNKQNNSRIQALLSGDSVERYAWFLKEYPKLLNRIPHYHIANFLGITPTQLSRTRKMFASDHS